MRDAGKTLDTFDIDFNKRMNRALVFELATGRSITQREDGLFLGRPASQAREVGPIGFDQDRNRLAGHSSGTASPKTHPARA